MIPDQLVSRKREKALFLSPKNPPLSHGGLVLTYCHCFGVDADFGALWSFWYHFETMHNHLINGTISDLKVPGPCLLCHI